MPKILETQRKVQEVQKKAKNLASRGSSRTWKEVVDDIGPLLSKESLAD